MTNFYEELKLDSRQGIGELNTALDQLELTWRRREITAPEKATQILALIIQAREVFASESSRDEYDRKLKQGKEKPKQADPNEERNKQFKKWWNEAERYYNNKQYDLAKTAIDKAMSFYDMALDNDSFYSLAAEIYRANKEYLVALDNINKAIVIQPNSALHYARKAQIHEGQAYQAENNRQFQEAAEFKRKAVDTANQALTTAQKQNDKYMISASYGLLAWYSMYFNSNRQMAQSYAEKGVSLGDAWGNAGRILKVINEQKRQEEIEIENRRREQEDRQRQERERKERQEREERERLEQNERDESEFKEIYRRKCAYDRRKKSFKYLAGLCGIILIAIFIYNAFGPNKNVPRTLDFVEEVLKVFYIVSCVGALFYGLSGFTSFMAPIGGIVEAVYIWGFSAKTYYYSHYIYGSLIHFGYGFKKVGLLLAVVAVPLIIGYTVAKAAKKHVYPCIIRKDNSYVVIYDDNSNNGTNCYTLRNALDVYHSKHS